MALPPPNHRSDHFVNERPGLRSRAQARRSAAFQRNARSDSSEIRWDPQQEERAANARSDRPGTTRASNARRIWESHTAPPCHALTEAGDSRETADRVNGETVTGVVGDPRRGGKVR
jgi:hypothetical protein